MYYFAVIRFSLIKHDNQNTFHESDSYLCFDQHLYLFARIERLSRDLVSHTCTHCGPNFFVLDKDLHLQVLQYKNS